MLYVAVMSVLFLAAGLAMVSKLGTSNSAAFETAAARASEGRRVRFGVRERTNFYIQQFNEALGRR